MGKEENGETKKLKITEEIKDTDGPEALVLAGQNFVCTMMRAMCEKIRKENPKLPGITWHVLYDMLDKIKSVKPTFEERA